MCENRKVLILDDPKNPIFLQVLQAILEEFDRATKIHPDWPTDPVHAAAILSEEAGEVIKAVNNAVTGKKDGKDSDYTTEAIQCGAMCLRFLVNLKTYDWDVKY